MDSSFNVADIKFDKIGNMYVMDRNGVISSNANKAAAILGPVKDFEVTLGKNIYALGTTSAYSTNAYTSVFDSANFGFGYKQFPVS